MLHLAPNFSKLSLEIILIWWACYEVRFVEYQVSSCLKNNGSSQLYSDSAYYKLKLYKINYKKH